MSQPYSPTGDRILPVLDATLTSAAASRLQALGVDYEPGGSSPGVHRHPAGAFVYVIEGAVPMGLNDEAPVLVRAGEKRCLAS